jgi:CBS domain-containing protein
VKGEKILGIITETDFFIKNVSSIFLPSYIAFLKENRTYANLSEEKKAEVNELLNAKASDIMTKNCITILQDMSIRDLLGFFRTTNFITLPVTDEDDRMVGIISISDIIGLLKA